MSPITILAGTGAVTLTSELSEATQQPQGQPSTTCVRARISPGITVEQVERRLSASAPRIEDKVMDQKHASWSPVTRWLRQIKRCAKPMAYLQGRLPLRDACSFIM